MTTSEILYIGDEVRDIVSTRKVGVNMIAVTWGYNARTRLQRESPGWLVDKPADILEVIKKLS